jgi:hypothetical protein
MNLRGPDLVELIGRNNKEPEMNRIELSFSGTAELAIGVMLLATIVAVLFV